MSNFTKTEFVALSFSDQLTKQIDTKSINLYIYTVFDTLDQTSLSSKLGHYGISGVTNGLLKSYLVGVPQGSVPGLLCLYMK